MEEQVVLGAWHTGDGYEKMKSELMRIFGERRENKEVGWMKGGGGSEYKNMNKAGLKKGWCGEEAQWARNCKKKKREPRCFHWQKAGHMT